MKGYSIPKIRSPVFLVFSIVICLTAGFLGSLVTITSAGSWYDQLTKPWFNPPSYVFGPVWTILYILIAIALYLVWVEGFEKREVKLAAGLFAIQLILNTGWSFAFFGLESPLFGFIEILVLWLFISATIWAFWIVRKEAALLMVPYLAWVTFATVLTYSIMVLNS
ncbi:MAG TPA: TspO/MBR family protein [Methanoregulaceae archaeon]|nr:TspO/MBR family protein [Methanoregulaceae archaeon]